jgi:hypothetical protein
VPGFFIPSPTPGGPSQEDKFLPDNPANNGVTSPTHGQMAISGPQGLTSTVFGTLKPPQNKGEPFTFLPDSANNLIPCDFIPDGGSTGASSPSPAIPGTYKTASGPNSPGVFNPSDPNAAPRETTHGNIVMKQPPNSPPIPGRLEPNDPSAGDEPSTSRFYPDPFGSYKVTFTPDDSPTSTTFPGQTAAKPVQGIFTPASQLGQPGQFQPSNPKEITQLPAHGLITPQDLSKGKPNSGTLNPGTSPSVDNFISDPFGTFYPSNNGNPIGGSVNSKPDGSAQFRPDNPFLMPQGQTNGVLKVPGDSDKSGTIIPPTGLNQPFTFVPFPPGSASAKFYKDDNPTIPIPGTLLAPKSSSETDPQEFIPSQSGLPQGKTRGQLVVDQPPGSSPIPGSLISPTSPGAPYLFVRDPPGSFRATYYMDGSSDPIQGLFIPSQQNTPGQTVDKFEPVYKTQLPKTESHGQLVPQKVGGGASQQPVSGTMGPQPTEQNPTTYWIPDPKDASSGT